MTLAGYRGGAFAKRLELPGSAVTGPDGVLSMSRAGHAEPRS